MLPTAESWALRAGSRAGAALCATQAERASSKATPRAPLSAAAAASSQIESRFAQASAASPPSSAARAMSVAIIIVRLAQRSTSVPSNKAPAAPAATSAMSSSAICNGVASSARVASQGSASRLSIEPKLEMPSPARTRRKSLVVSAGVAAAEGVGSKTAA